MVLECVDTVRHNGTNQSNEEAEHVETAKHKLNGQTNRQTDRQLIVICVIVIVVVTLVVH